MRRPRQATVKRLASKPSLAQWQIATHGEPYAAAPAVYDLARAWADNLDYVKTARAGKPVAVFAKAGRPDTVKHSAIQAMLHVADMVHYALETGNANELRRFADALEDIAANRPDADPLRAAMLRYAARSIGPLFYSLQPPLRVPFTEPEITEALAEELLDAPDPSEVRRAARQLGWVFKPAKKGRRKLGL